MLAKEGKVLLTFATVAPKKRRRCFHDTLVFTLELVKFHLIFIFSILQFYTPLKLICFLYIDNYIKEQ